MLSKKRIDELMDNETVEFMDSELERAFQAFRLLCGLPKKDKYATIAHNLKIDNKISDGLINLFKFYQSIENYYENGEIIENLKLKIFVKKLDKIIAKISKRTVPFNSEEYLEFLQILQKKLLSEVKNIDRKITEMQANVTNIGDLISTNISVELMREELVENAFYATAVNEIRKRYMNNLEESNKNHR